MPRFFKKQFLQTEAQRIEAERERRVATRDRVDYSYTIFWMKTARLWDAVQRERVLRHLTDIIASPDFDANFYQRAYTVEGVDGAHAGASLLALQKVLQALRAA